MAYELDNGDNSLTEPNFCIVYCCSIFVGVDIFSSALYLGFVAPRRQVDSGGFRASALPGGIASPGGELVQGGSGTRSTEEERDLD